MLTIQEHIDLLPYNTFQVSCLARYFVVVKSEQELQELIQTPIWKDQEQKIFLGGGSNILFVSPSYDGIVVKNECMGKKIQSVEDRIQNTEQSNPLSLGPCGRAVASQHTSTGSAGHEGTLIEVGAGENRDEFVHRAIDQGYCGVENLVSIPGTVGAAPVQNIGAYGVEVESMIECVEGVDMGTGEIKKFTHDECGFGYRDSVFKKALKGKVCITAVTFRLQKYVSESYSPLVKYGAVSDRLGDERITPFLIADTIAQIRAEKLPDWKKIGTAGSFFKNPIVSEEAFVSLEKEFGVKGWTIELSSPDKTPHPTGTPLLKGGTRGGYELQTKRTYYKLSAGQLIDMAGMKGFRLGDIGVSLDHALVLVNYGEREGAKFLELIGLIQKKVEGMFGVRLEPEVNVL